MAATPYSYRQYTGNGSNKSFAVPFPYLLKAHVHVYLGFNLLDGTFTLELAETTGFTWTSGTAIQTVAAPASGQTLTVIRQTPNSQQVVQYQDGSTLIANDLNTSDLQNLYVVQEQQDRNDAGIAVSLTAKTAGDAAAAAATTATTAANAATTAANTATTAANTATTASTAATSTATYICIDCGYIYDGSEGPFDKLPRGYRWAVAICDWRRKASAHSCPALLAG